MGRRARPPSPGGKALDAALAGGADRRVLGDELLAVVGVIDGSATLRRALADPSREGTEKQALAERLLDGKVSAEAIVVVKNLVGQRWATERDLSDTLEDAGRHVDPRRVPSRPAGSTGSRTSCSASSGSSPATPSCATA